MAARAVILVLGVGLLAATAAPAGAAARSRCGRSRVLLTAPARHCVRSGTLTRGVAGTHDGLGAALVRKSGALREPGERVTGLLARAQRSAIARWEVALASAGWKAARKARATARAGARAAQAEGTETLGLQVAGPLDWAQTAATVIQDPVGAVKGLLRAPASTTGTTATLQGPGGETYSADIEEAKPTGVYCPSQQGVVKATGSFRIRRTLTVGRSTRTEEFIVTYVITGRVNRQAKLQDYDVEVKLSAAAAGSGTLRATGTATGIRPRPSSSTAVIVPASSVSISGSSAAGVQALAATAIGFAQRAGLSFIQDAEERFDKEATCLRAVPTPASVARGATAVVKVEVVSRLTGKKVDSDLTLTPAGGATVSPSTITTTPTKPAKVKVKMPPKKAGGARAAAAPSVAVVGRSESGRATGSVGSSDTAHYRVALMVTGAGHFGVWDSSGRIDLTYDAVPTGFGQDGLANRWEVPGLPVIWKDVTAVSNLPDCQMVNPIGTDVLNVVITSVPATDQIKVNWFVPHGALMTATVICKGVPVPGEGILQMIAMQPSEFLLPAAGGAQHVGSLLTGAGWFADGTMTVTAVPA